MANREAELKRDVARAVQHVIADHLDKHPAMVGKQVDVNTTGTGSVMETWITIKPSDVDGYAIRRMYKVRVSEVM